MILIGDIFEKIGEIADNSVHCAITSPPYWGLRDYGVDGQIGLEPTMQEYIAKMVQVFREVRRVLRPDGVCFLNLGDSYAGNGVNASTGSLLNKSSHISNNLNNNGKCRRDNKVPVGLKPKDLCGIPWRVALALQDDGWWLRSDIIWAKPNPMPESVTDRPTKSHEYIFLLTKSSKYFWDVEGVREGNQVFTRKAGGYKNHSEQMIDDYKPFKGKGGFADSDVTTVGRNLRTVWTIPTESFSGAHFATFPQKLVETCIKAGTSEWGCCPECGKAWVRVVEKSKSTPTKNSSEIRNNQNGKDSTFVMPIRYCVETQTLGWRPSCSCPTADPIPCTVLDPFFGSGTTGLVAQKMGRRWLGIELNPEYASMARKRLGRNLFEEENYG